MIAPPFFALLALALGFLAGAYLTWIGAGIVAAILAVCFWRSSRGYLDEPGGQERLLFFLGTGAFTFAFVVGLLCQHHEPVMKVLDDLARLLVN